ncbi:MULTISPECIES: hypothetical protein [Enterococcus]|nr:MULTISPECIES: hypothetical protein [Enterococcus]
MLVSVLFVSQDRQYKKSFWTQTLDERTNEQFTDKQSVRGQRAEAVALV